MCPTTMKSKENRPSAAENCARQALETIPMVMRAIRREMRSATDENLSVPQFRVLVFLGRHRGASLSSVSEHLGVKDATTSAMVDRLVKRGLVARETHPLERRRVELGLTAEGTTLMEGARAKAWAFLVARLASASQTDLQSLAQGLDVMRRLLSEEMPS